MVSSLYIYIRDKILFHVEFYVSIIPYYTCCSDPSKKLTADVTPKDDIPGGNDDVMKRLKSIKAKGKYI